jgi:glycosyltransferase involved in cell wall biosynthesis
VIYLVIPCFNEAKRLQVSYWERIITSTNLDNVTFLFIDDGSSDGTFEVLNGFTKYNRVETIFLDVNAGKANAIRTAFQKILEMSFFDCDLIGFIDCDSSFDAEEVISILSRLENQSKHFDAFFYSRVKLSGSQIRRSEIRHVISRIIYTFIARGWNWAPYDTQSGFKVFRNSDVMKDVVSTPFRTRWFFEIEFMNRLSMSIGSQLNIKEIPLHYWQERSGSKIKARKYLSIFREILIARRFVKQMSSFN